MMLQDFKYLIKSFKGTIFMLLILFVMLILQHYQIKTNEAELASNFLKTLVFINYFIMIFLETRRFEIIKHFCSKSVEKNRLKYANNLFNLIYSTVVIIFTISIMTLCCQFINFNLLFNAVVY